ncbi:hypothetical protein Tco_1045117 [Tanacetum coccineum]|uniref:Uncharacterized protein n=1 Tax=Tanacetum coccineum TaxID=301880 RepID=A0ABQ5GRV2_9ASTR
MMPPALSGDAGVKNGVFIPTGEKIWRRNGICEKRKKDPYNISEERITKKYEIQIQVKGGMSGYDVSEFTGELLMITVTPIGRRKQIDRKIKDERIIFRKRRIRISSGTATTRGA